MPKSDQGVFYDRYKVIPRCLIFTERSNGDVLLIKGKPDKRLWANKYNGVGGHIEPGESVKHAVRRELLEETGLMIDDIWLCGIVMVDASESVGICIFVYKGVYSNGEVINSLEGDISWVSTQDFSQIPLVDDLHILLPKVLMMKKGDEPFSAHYSYDEQDKMVISFTS